MNCSIYHATFLLALGMITAPAWAANDNPVQVFILAGQSNMQGQGVVDLDHPQHYNGGRGILNRVMKESPLKQRYSHLKDKQGRWTVREDVWVRYRVKSGLSKGGLSIGFSGYADGHHMGTALDFSGSRSALYERRARTGAGDRPRSARSPAARRALVGRVERPQTEARRVSCGHRDWARNRRVVLEDLEALSLMWRDTRRPFRSGARTLPP